MTFDLDLYLVRLEQTRPAGDVQHVDEAGRLEVSAFAGQADAVETCTIRYTSYLCGICTNLFDAVPVSLALSAFLTVRTVLRSQ